MVKSAGETEAGVDETARTRNLCGLLLEGVPCTGKTAVIRAILSSGVLGSRGSVSVMILGEHLTQRAIEAKEDAGTITLADNLALLETTVRALEGYGEVLSTGGWRRDQDGHELAFLLERFHLTHALHYDHVSWDDVAGFDRRLADLGTRLVVLAVGPDEMAERILGSRDDGWRGYIARFGDDEAVLRHYRSQQEGFLTLARRSAMEHMVLDTSSADWEGLARRTLDFWLG